MVYKILVVAAMRGVNLSGAGPGLSALKICNPPTPKVGKIAKVRTKIPIPPNQCVKERQKRSPLGKLSISGITVAPVVVKPETVSKKASTKLGTLPEKTKGKAPKKEVSVHPKVTTKIASLALSREDVALIFERKRPINPIIPMANKRPKTASRS